MAPFRLLEVPIRNHLDHEGQKTGPVLLDCGDTVKGFSQACWSVVLNCVVGGPCDAAKLGNKL